MKMKSRKAHVIEEVTQEVDDLNLLIVVFEVNLIGSNPREW